MHESHYKKVYSGNFIIAQLITKHLEEADINVVVKDESESGRLAGFGSSIQGFQELYIHEDEYKKALPIVESVLSQTTT